jgi:hypothetical protein
LFYEYIYEVLIPYLVHLREKPIFANETAILLMDSAPPRLSERVLRLLGENKMLAGVFPAHTTNVVQALDLVFLGAMKKLKATVPGEFGEDSMDEQIPKLLQAYEQTATSMGIRGSFRKAGIYPIVESGALKVNFEEEKLHNNAESKELRSATSQSRNYHEGADCRYLGSLMPSF